MNADLERGLQMADAIERAMGDRDPLRTLWACLTCWWKGRMGEMSVQSGVAAEHALRCPRCGSGDVEPADGAVRTVGAYHGPIGTRH